MNYYYFLWIEYRCNSNVDENLQWYKVKEINVLHGPISRTQENMKEKDREGVDNTMIFGPLG